VIGLENAKRLKELGVYPYGTGDTGSDIKHTLSQLLEEVEKQGCLWELFVDLYEDDETWYVFRFTHHGHQYSQSATSPEDAVALALIAILEGEK